MARKLFTKGKNQPRQGLYAIVNNKDKKVLMGISGNAEQLLRSIHHRLKKGYYVTGKYKDLQGDFSLYGKDSFDFFIIKLSDDIVELEKELLVRIDSAIKKGSQLYGGVKHEKYGADLLRLQGLLTTPWVIYELRKFMDAMDKKIAE